MKEIRNNFEYYYITFIGTHCVHFQLTVNAYWAASNGFETLNITIEIAFVNDPPTLHCSYNLHISEDAEVGDQVTTVTIIDPDIRNNQPAEWGTVRLVGEGNIH